MKARIRQRSLTASLAVAMSALGMLALAGSASADRTASTTGSSVTATGYYNYGFTTAAP